MGESIYMPRQQVIKEKTGKMLQVNCECQQVKMINIKLHILSEQQSDITYFIYQYL